MRACSFPLVSMLLVMLSIQGLCPTSSSCCKVFFWPVTIDPPVTVRSAVNALGGQLRKLKGRLPVEGRALSLCVLDALPRHHDLRSHAFQLLDTRVRPQGFAD